MDNGGPIRGAIKRWREWRVARRPNSAAAGIRAQKAKLAQVLDREGIPREVVRRLTDSGYAYAEMRPPGAELLLQSGDPRPSVYDTFYGTKVFFGMTPMDVFIDYLRDGLFPVPRGTPTTHTVVTLDEAAQIIASGRHARYMQAGQLSFRGQNREYWVTRPFPNPVLSDESGRERLIVPGFWRRFSGNWERRYLYEPRHLYAMVNGNLGLNGRFRLGIPLTDAAEWASYGDAPDYQFALASPNDDGADLTQIPVVEQHYGVATDWLDLTFDLRVALFFATHRYLVRNDGSATFEPIESGRHEGVVYCFRFVDPGVTRTSDLIRRVELMRDSPAVRPLRQQCALRRFWAGAINEAITDVDLVLKLHPKFPIRITCRRHTSSQVLKRIHFTQRYWLLRKLAGPPSILWWSIGGDPPGRCLAV